MSRMRRGFQKTVRLKRNKFITHARFPRQYHNSLIRRDQQRQPSIPSEIIIIIQKFSGLFRRKCTEQLRKSQLPTSV